LQLGNSQQSDEVTGFIYFIKTSMIGENTFGKVGYTWYILNPLSHKLMLISITH